MKTHIVLHLVVATVLVTVWNEAGYAAPPAWMNPFRRGVEANRNESYDLAEDHGPWLILAAAFSVTEQTALGTDETAERTDQTAEQQATELVHELRSRFNLPAYLHRQSYDFSKPVEGLSIDKYTGGRARMRYDKDDKFMAYAVLVGHFESVDDPELAKTLKQIKHLHPSCLDPRDGETSTQSFAGIRNYIKNVSAARLRRNQRKGAMGSAFATLNPFLPEDYLHTKGLDDFVVKLNRGVKYSLLDNPGRYTVKVATFRGSDRLTVKASTTGFADPRLKREIGDNDVGSSDKLAIAADKAHRLTIALRKKGVDAYEFHDRHESIVAIGSFDSVGEPRADGRIEINPIVHQILQLYGASRKPLPGQASFGLQPRTLNGISFDVQPVPVEVPRRSIAAAYARRR